MKAIGAILVFLNAVCGVIFVILALWDFDFHWLIFPVPVVSSLFLIHGFESERKNITLKHFSPGSINKEVPEIDQKSSFVYFVINLIFLGFVVILLPFPLHEDIRLFLYLTGGGSVFYYNFEEIGKELARSKLRKTNILVTYS